MNDPSAPARHDAAATVRRSARDRIFEAARELFYRQGIHGVGVEAIAEQAGATKMSLYRAFPGKDELVAACLRHNAGQFWTWWDQVAAQHAPDARATLLALFAELAGQQQSPEHRGCPIANAAVELTAEHHPASAVVAAYNAEKRRRLLQLCGQLGVRDPDALADGLQLLMDGAALSRVTCGRDGPCRGLSAAAQALIDHAPRA